MAALGNTFQTFAAKGIREQLLDRIYDISPEQTPFMSNGQRGTLKNTFFEWQTDALAAADGSNAQIQGDDIDSFDAVTPTVRLGNYTQISRKTAIVADTLEATDRAGRKGEMAYQLAKKSKELKRDIETVLTRNQGASAGNSSTASTTASVLAFIKTNVSKDAGGNNPSYTTLPSDTRDDGTQRAFTETLLKSVLKLGYDNGAEFSICMVGSFNKQAASAFSGIAQIRKAVEGQKQATIIGAADVYVSDFGDITFVPNRFSRARDALLLDPEMYSVDWLRPFATKPLAKTGDAEKRLIICEYGLRVNNELGLGGVFDLLTS